MDESNHLMCNQILMREMGCPWPVFQRNLKDFFFLMFALLDFYFKGTVRNFVFTSFWSGKVREMWGFLFVEEVSKPAVFNWRATKYWCAMKGLQVRRRTLRYSS